MKQYCRYCAHATDYNGDGEDFICSAPAPCGNNGAGQMYPASKAKRANACPHFCFNQIDVFGGVAEDGTFKQYHPRTQGPGKRTTLTLADEGQLRLEDAP